MKLKLILKFFFYLFGIYLIDVFVDFISYSDKLNIILRKSLFDFEFIFIGAIIVFTIENFLLIKRLLKKNN
jgi:hypothetical protein